MKVADVKTSLFLYYLVLTLPSITGLATKSEGELSSPNPNTSPITQLKSTEASLDIQNFYNQLLYTTVKIETWLAAQPERTSSGTGYFFHLPRNEQEMWVLLVTNRHVARLTDDEGKVVGEFDSGRVTLHVKDPATEQPLLESYSLTMTEWGAGWVDHPDASIDLCAMNVTGILKLKTPKGLGIFYRALVPSLLPSADILDDFQALEQVVMVGYPQSLADEYHNFPLMRTGTTASHPGLNYQGKPEIAIDMAVIRGSSGSPVFLVQDHGYTKDGQHQMDLLRRFFLGVLYGGPTYTETGEIVISPGPTTNMPKVKIRTWMNLGYIIKAEQLLAFKDVFEAIQTTPPVAIALPEPAE